MFVSGRICVFPTTFGRRQYLIESGQSNLGGGREVDFPADTWMQGNMDPSGDCRHSIPESHSIRRVFRSLTSRALDRVAIRDQGLLVYLSDMLVDFVHADSFFRLQTEEGRRMEYLADMLRAAEFAPVSERKGHYRYIGDYSLFVLGMFPSSIERIGRAIPKSYYMETGRRSYRAAGGLEEDPDSVIVFRTLADRYERCVVSLNWVSEYCGNSFYQYMLREFGIT